MTQDLPLCPTAMHLGNGQQQTQGFEPSTQLGRVSSGLTGPGRVLGPAFGATLFPHSFFRVSEPNAAHVCCLLVQSEARVFGQNHSELGGVWDDPYDLHF